MGGANQSDDDDSERSGWGFGDFDFSSISGNFSPDDMTEGADMENFSPGDMPSMGSFTLPGSGDTDSESDDSSGRKRPSSFSGMPGQQLGQSKATTLAGYGICLLIMIAALFVTKHIKRRR